MRKTPGAIELDSSSGGVWMGETPTPKKPKKSAGDPKASLKGGKRRLPDFWPGGTARTTESPVPIALDTDAPRISDGWNRVDDTIAMAITNREGQDMEETPAPTHPFPVESMGGFSLFHYSAAWVHTVRL